MIRAEFTFGADDCVTGFSVKGHSGYASQGEDIVCASVSSAVYMTANTITEIIKVTPDTLSESDGLIELRLNDADAEKSKDILSGFLLHMTELEKMQRAKMHIDKLANGIDPLTDTAELSEMLNAWAEQSEKYHNGDINRDEYDKWRYNYPKYDETSSFVKVPSQNLSNAMVEAFKDKL